MLGAIEEDEVSARDEGDGHIGFLEGEWILHRDRPLFTAIAGAGDEGEGLDPTFDAREFFPV